MKKDFSTNTNLKCSNLTFLGQNISELTRDELLDAIEYLYKDYEYFRKLYFNAQESKVEIMGDMIKLKFA